MDKKKNWEIAVRIDFVSHRRHRHLTMILP